MYILGFLGFDLRFNLGFWMVLSGIFEGFWKDLGFRFGVGFGIVLPRFSRVLDGFFFGLGFWEGFEAT